MIEHTSANTGQYNVPINSISLNKTQKSKQLLTSIEHYYAISKLFL